jgi:uncharacterized membrane protein
MALRRDPSVWFVVGITLIADIAVLTISEESFLMPLRWVVGYVFSFFVPGYSAMMALFPHKDMGSILKVVFSVGLSLAILPLVGLGVNLIVGSIALPYIMLALTLLVYSLTLKTIFVDGDDDVEKAI